MNCGHFLPNWYLEKIKIKKLKILKIFIIMFFIVDLILIDMIMINRSKINTINDETNEKIILLKANADEKAKLHSNNTETLNTFLKFEEDIYKNIDFKSLNIEKRNIDIKFNIKPVDFAAFIKKIEDTNKFNITYINDSHKDDSLSGRSDDNSSEIRLQVK
ncbi:hypothetical protein [Clostridium sp. JS66]|uniref:hypothetical protein n=1 Tax=Clostridium sp. JS66 TaxID=3064705 RepID=UPI00298E8299|nr:hypothetical protein [Clostridium sp. JS66]WPC40926.1 hypothetical protein Q6H37_23995 [Clostridium sp. JS66]